MEAIDIEDCKREKGKSSLRCTRPEIPSETIRIGLAAASEERAARMCAERSRICNVEEKWASSKLFTQASTNIYNLNFFNISTF